MALRKGRKQKKKSRGSTKEEIKSRGTKGGTICDKDQKTPEKEGNQE